MSDAVKIQIILGVVALLAILFNGVVSALMTYVMMSLKTQQAVQASLAAEKIEEVRLTTAQVASEQKEQADEVKQTLAENAKEMARQTEAVKKAQAATDARQTEQAVLVKDTLAAGAIERAASAEAVRITLATATSGTDAKLEELAVVAKSTHTLVNSNMGEQLKINALLARKVAQLEPDDQGAASVARDAETKYHEHQSKQAKVDAMDGTDDEKRGG